VILTPETSQKLGVGAREVVGEDERRGKGLQCFESVPVHSGQWFPVLQFGDDAIIG